MDLYTIALSIFGLFLLWKLTIAPTVVYCRWKDQRVFQRDYRFFMLESVKKYYPAAEELTLRELEERYDIVASFNQIGRPGFPLSANRYRSNDR